jgi:hypothetical protein
MVAQELGAPENLGWDSILVDHRATELEGIETPQNPPDDGDIIALRVEANERGALFEQLVKEPVECRSIAVDHPIDPRPVKPEAPAVAIHLKVKNEGPPEAEEGRSRDGCHLGGLILTIIWFSIIGGHGCHLRKFHSTATGAFPWPSSCLDRWAQFAC